MSMWRDFTPWEMFIYQQYPDDRLLTLSKAVKKVVDDKAKYTDWNARDDIKAELKADLKFYSLSMIIPLLIEMRFIRRYLSRQRILRGVRNEE